MLLSARRQALVEEIACCTNERESYNAEDELLPKRHDLAAQTVSTLKRRVEAWQEIVRVRRQREADATLEQAEREKRIVSPELRGLADENEKLAERLNQINHQVAAAGKRTVEFANALSELQRRFQGMTMKVELGLAQQLGPYLLQFRTELLRQRRKFESLRLPQSQIDAVSLQWLDLTEQRNRLSDLDQQTEEAMHGLDPSNSRSRRELLAVEARGLLESRRELLDALIGAYDRYLREMGPLIAADKELFGAFARQLGYVEERVFWVRSTAQFSTGDLAAAGEALEWYLEPRQWQAIARQCTRRLAGRPLTCLTAGVLFAVLVAAQRNLRHRLRELGERAARGAANDMTLTRRAFVLTLLTAAPWPGLLAFLAWLLDRPADGAELCAALAHGLSFTAAALAFIEFWRQVCRSRGLGVAHFAWPEQSTRLLRKQLRWFVPIALPLTILGTTTHALDNDRWESLGRLGFIAAMVLLSLLIQRVFRPIGGVLHEYLALRRGQWVHRLHHLFQSANATVRGDGAPRRHRSRVVVDLGRRAACTLAAQRAALAGRWRRRNVSPRADQGGPRFGGGVLGDPDHRRDSQHPRLVGDRAAATTAARTDHALRDDHAVPVRHRRDGDRRRLPGGGRHLVEDPLARGGRQRRFRLRLAGNLRQFRFGSDYLVRAPDPRRRHRDDRRRKRRSFAHSHPRHHDHRFRLQGTGRPQ